MTVPQDVEDRWRPLSDQETTVAWSLIEQAEAILAVAVVGIRDRAAVSPDLAIVFRGVVVSMVSRVMKNPDAIRQFSVDDYSQTRDQVASSGLLYATPEELAQLAPAPMPMAGMFVVGLGG